MKIRVFQQHTHAGVTYPAGSEIELPEDDAQWLLMAEKARRVVMIEDADRFRRIFGRKNEA